MRQSHLIFLEIVDHVFDCSDERIEVGLVAAVLLLTALFEKLADDLGVVLRYLRHLLLFCRVGQFFYCVDFVVDQLN